jgi:hypothetical protein
LDSNNPDKIIAVKKYNKKFEVTKSLNVSEKLNVFQLLITKLVKSGQSNDLDLQKEILTKLHKNGFDDGTISTLYHSTLNICAFEKTFRENEDFLKIVEFPDQDTNKEIPNTKITIGTVIEDKKELQKELKENILNSTNFNIELIANTINNNNSPVPNNATTLAAVLNVKPVVAECNGTTIFSRPSVSR